MKKLRLISLLLLTVMCLGLLASCVNLNTNGTNNQGGGDRTDGSWDGVDFEGQKVNFCISVNKYVECSFPEASVYTRGPDSAGSNEVYKEVLARNKAAEETLGLKIVYSGKDLTYDLILDEMQECIPSEANVETEYDAKELSAAINRFLAELKPEDRFLFFLTIQMPLRIHRTFRCQDVPRWSSSRDCRNSAAPR